MVLLCYLRVTSVLRPGNVESAQKWRGSPRSRDRKREGPHFAAEQVAPYFRVPHPFVASIKTVRYFALPAVGYFAVATKELADRCKMH